MPGAPRVNRLFALSIVAAVVCGVTAASADDQVIGPMPWMTRYPATWNAGAPKMVSDGLHDYAVLCGGGGSDQVCGIERRRGLESWTQGTWTFGSNQPAVVVMDRKGRLNVFYNDLLLHHVRFDHPSVNLASPVEIPVPFSLPVAYLHASYDAGDDILMLAFVDPSTWITHFGIKYTDANGWVLSTLPPPAAGTMNLYARTLRSRGRYFVMVGEHPIDSTNSTYTAVRLFESASPIGPWAEHVVHRATGQNMGLPYQNWVVPLDLQQDSAGDVRALMQIDEDASGHPHLAEGLYVAREEDGYAPRFVGAGIDDGYTLEIDPSSGASFAFALIVSGRGYPEGGHLAAFRSTDAGVTWTGPQRVGSEIGINPVAVDLRSGSMLGGKGLSLIYSTGVSAPYDRVMSTSVPLPLVDTPERYDYWYSDADGTQDYVRAYRDTAADRSYYYVYDYATDGSFTVTYCYTAGSYYEVYIGNSRGGYRYYDSDGYQVTQSAPEITQYWYTDTRDGSRDYVYIYKDPANSVYYWYVIDYDTTGTAWTKSYVYYQGPYWLMEFTGSDGHFRRSDSTGMNQVG